MDNAISKLRANLEIVENNISILSDRAESSLEIANICALKHLNYVVTDIVRLIEKLAE